MSHMQTYLMHLEHIEDVDLSNKVLYIIIMTSEITAFGRHLSRSS